MGGKVKRGTGKNRGYIGYHITWDNKKVFLRSKVEFITARMLDIEKIPYLLEFKDYTINNRGYRPDFFLFKDTTYNDIIKIIEIKGQDNKSESLEYKNLFYDYFKEMGILYEVIWNFNPIIKKYQLQDDIKRWIQNSIDKYDFISDVRGSHNPMFNKKHSTETKKKISELAKKRCNTPEYKQKISNNLKVFWETERGHELKKIISIKRKEISKTKNPIIECVCKGCGDSFNKKTLSKKTFCDAKCERKWKYSNISGYGKHKDKNSGYRKNLLSYINKIIKYYNITQDDFFNDITNIIIKAKKDNIIPKNKGITKQTLKKYNIN